MKNRYAGLSYEALKAIRRDLMNLRTGHLREAERLMAEARRVGAVLKDAEREAIGISDHAVIRWLERVGGVDTEAVRQEIKAHVAAHDLVGDGFVIEGAGVRVCMADNRVTTVMPARGSDPTP